MTSVRQAAIVLLILLFLCPAAAPPTRAVAQEIGKGKAAPAAEINPLKVAGKWLRSDGGYVLELSEVGFGGALTATYRNPEPINVSRAAWRLQEGLVVVGVELQDVNYPGSTYTLAYFPDRDVLAGYYYQAAQGQNYEVLFERMKGDD